MIRTIRPEDASAVAAICERALGHRTSADLIARRTAELAGDDAYFIAVALNDQQDVVGFIQAQRYDLLYGERGYNIIALAVAPEDQGQGFGRALLCALESHALSRGCTFVRLNSRVDRTDAHAFYEHLGYRCDKTQKRLIRSLNA